METAGLGEQEAGDSGTKKGNAQMGGGSCAGVGAIAGVGASGWDVGGVGAETWGTGTAR